MPMQTQAPLDEYELLRKRALQQANAQTQAQDDALKRRFAAMGQLNSGASIKQMQLNAQAGAERADQAQEGISIAEAQERQRRKEVTEGRDFASGEAQKQRDFTSAESKIGREWQTGERLSSQSFASQQAAEQRGWQTKENEINRKLQGDMFDRGQEMQKLLADRDSDFREKAFDFEKGSKMDQMKLAWEQFYEEQRTTAFNKKIAEWEQQQAGRGIIGGLLGSGGVFGTVGELFGAKWDGMSQGQAQASGQSISQSSKKNPTTTSPYSYSSPLYSYMRGGYYR
jgi:hypothetical protein